MDSASSNQRYTRMPAEIKSLVATDAPELALKYRYEAIIDYMLANPHMKQGEIALYVGVTQAWMSQVIGSNGFQARYNQRRNELNEEQTRSQNAKIFAIADKAADRVIEELDKGSECDAGFALDASTRAIRAMGFGMPNKKTVEEVGPRPDESVGSETLAAARAAINSHSVRLTRVTESVEISPGDEPPVSGYIEGTAELGESKEVQGQAEERPGL